jgi:hypothetical protein
MSADAWAEDDRVSRTAWREVVAGGHSNRPRRLSDNLESQHQSRTVPHRIPFARSSRVREGA